MVLKYEPFQLEAHLLRGFVGEQSTLDLAGILASCLWKKAKAEPRNSFEDSNVDNPVDLELPLDMCFEAGEDDWHWMGTCGYWESSESKQEPGSYYKQVNDSWVSRTATRPIPYISSKSGAYRDMMMPSFVNLTPKVTWWGVGDTDQIMQLVQSQKSIGKRRMKGEGRVLRWEIKTLDHNDGWEISHFGLVGKILRPIPVACAKKHGVQYDLAWSAIRPPAWNPNRLRELAVQPEEQAFFPSEWEL